MQEWIDEVLCSEERLTWMPNEGEDGFVLLINNGEIDDRGFAGFDWLILYSNGQMVGTSLPENDDRSESGTIWVNPDGSEALDTPLSVVAFKTFLSFLSAAAEQYRCLMEENTPGEPIFKQPVMQWAYDYDQAISVATSDLGE